MKKLYTFLMMLLLVSGVAFGQPCTINTNTTGWGLLPSAVTVTAGSAFSAPVNVTVRRDTSVSQAVPGFGNVDFTIRYTSIVFDSVTGFPAGLPMGSTDAAQATSLYGTANPSPLSFTFSDTTAGSTDLVRRGCVTLSGTTTVTISPRTASLIAKTDGYVILPATVVGVLLNGFPPILPAPCPQGFTNPFLLSAIPSCITNDGTIGPVVSGLVAGFRSLPLNMEMTINAPSAIEDLASRYALSLYPNPASSESRLRFTLPAATDVRVELMDVTGRALRTLAEGSFAAGEHSLALNAESLEAGIYLVRTQIQGASHTTKLVVN